MYVGTYRVSNKKSYSSFWLVFKNACANLIQTYHEHNLKDGKNYIHKSKQFGRVTTSGMRLAWKTKFLLFSLDSTVGFQKV